MGQKLPTITPQLIAAALAWVVSQAFAFGVLDAGTSQTIIAVGGIVIPAALAIAKALHLGLVHAAVVAAGTPAAQTPAPVRAKPKAAVVPVK